MEALAKKVGIFKALSKEIDIFKALTKDISFFKVLVEGVRFSILSIHPLVVWTLIGGPEKNTFRRTNIGVIVDVI